MYQPTRDQSRQLLFDTWLKYRQRETLSDMEVIVLEVILLHPEYHGILEDPQQYLDKDYPPGMGVTNPFLHMVMHVAIKEQLSINQPAGICDRFDRLLRKTEDEHETIHQIMECLAEMIWQAQRSQTTPDESIYFKCLDKQLET